MSFNQDFRKAIDYLERVADLFENEEVTFRKPVQEKVAHLAAQLEQYPKAIEILKKQLGNLAAAVDEEDVEKFTGSIMTSDGITRLGFGGRHVIDKLKEFVGFGRDPWKTALLLRAKNKLHGEENEEDDLT
ncbi:hypothetical protein HPP92_001882 [Vanilla planifolia]|uniref:Uncharacterized protein n=1 Tax=Vanilla planifolia TaxID=51239 RepID=A0A835S4U9_VANPL|nr:hypothetical protein HPP92_002124 [Vanilla planifolia]KAG0501810.1 hypothetical protein HPP92_001882 [Vanilla planifolia]